MSPKGTKLKGNSDEQIMTPEQRIITFLNCTSHFLMKYPANNPRIRPNTSTTKDTPPPCPCLTCLRINSYQARPNATKNIMST